MAKKRLIDAGDIVAVAEKAYDAWNLAMATADGKREINLVYKRQQRFLGYLKTWIRAINMDDGTLAEILEIAQKEVGYDVHFLEGGK